MPKIFRQMLQHDALGGMLLIAAACAAMIMANTPLSSAYAELLALPVSVVAGGFSIDKPLLLWVNDGLMAIFFFLIGLEVKRELNSGHLRSRENVMLPAIAALAGLAVPALVYAALNAGEPQSIQGWAIPAATDIAFALGVFSLFGTRLPISLKIFLLSVAIFDDLAAIVIIALFYSQELSLLSLVVAGIGLSVLLLFNRMNVTRTGFYLLVGIVVWAAVLKSGVHATLAGFAVAMLIPTTAKNEYGHAILEELEHNLQPWVAYFILPFFAFANAGVSFAGLGADDFFNPITLGIAAGLFIGKQVGIFGACWLAVKAGLAKLPEDSNWQQLYGVSLLCGIGFTMSLFIGSLAFEGFDSSYLNSVKIGVIAGSLLSASLGCYVLYRCSRER